MHAAVSLWVSVNQLRAQLSTCSNQEQSYRTSVPASSHRNVSMDSKTVESVESFVYSRRMVHVGWIILTRLIGLACAVIMSFTRLLSDKRPTLYADIRIYHALVMHALLYRAVTKSAGTTEFVMTKSCKGPARQATLSRLQSCRRPCLYGHVAWLGEDTPVNKSLRLHIMDLLTACAGDVHLADHGTSGSANLETALTVPSETSALDLVTTLGG